MCSDSHSELAAGLTEEWSWIIYMVRITELPASCPTLVWKCKLCVWQWTRYVVVQARLYVTPKLQLKSISPPPLALRPYPNHGHLLRFLDHTQWRTTVGKTPLEEWSHRRRDLYLTAHYTHNRQISKPSAGFEPTVPAKNCRRHTP